MLKIMAKKTTVPQVRAKIYSPFYEGFLDEMPIEAKEKMKNDNPKLHKQIFGE
jgi:hypothetical protein